MNLNSLQRLGHATIDWLAAFGRSAQLLFRLLTMLPRPRQGFPLFVRQLFSVGVLSLPIIVVSGLFIGMVLGLQGYNILVDFSSEDAVGQMVALTLVRELAPVVTALLFAGRAGSALTAEIGLMKTTEQLASMEMMGVDPLRRVASPRFWASFVALPLLAMIFAMVGIWGGMLVGVEWLGIHDGAFWNNMQSAVDFGEDVLNGIIKAVVFGLVCAWIAVHQGFDAVPTSEGISRATTRTVVYSSLAILGLDFVLTAVMFGDY